MNAPRVTVTHIGAPSPERIAAAVLAVLSRAPQYEELLAIEEREPADAEPDLPPAA